MQDTGREGSKVGGSGQLGWTRGQEVRQSQVGASRVRIWGMGVLGSIMKPLNERSSVISVTWR